MEIEMTKVNEHQLNSPLCWGSRGFRQAPIGDTLAVTSNADLSEISNTEEINLASLSLVFSADLSSEKWGVY